MNNNFIKNIFIKKYFIKNRNYFSIPMMPYPSGKLHIGHIRNYAINDIINRFLNFKKYNTYKYIGWDCFGTPAENASISYNITPFKWIYKNIFYMKKQLKYIGFFNNWNICYVTCNKKYYKISQWIFIKLLKNNFIYFNKKKINWDPIEKTVLSNEQVINGFGWRSGAKIKLLKKKTYFVNILKYKKELFNELFNLNWPKKIKLMQFNWIGKFNLIYYKLYLIELNKYINISIKKIDEIINIYLFFLIKNFYKIANIFLKKNNLLFFFKKSNKIYYNTGLFFFNYLNFKKIELWKIKIKIKIKIKKNIIYNFEERNIFYNYFDYIFFFKKKYNKFFKNYIIWKIKDWGISRQRYWGTPIPIVNCDKCGFLNNKIKFILPKNLNPHKNNNILFKNIYYANNLCFICKKKKNKELDTLDTFFDSSWYFLNYLNFKKKNNIINKWFPVDFYSGGVEHAILHLLYSRFIIKFLRDIKYLNYGEPINYLFTQGMILNKTYYIKNNNLINWINLKDLNKNEKYFEGKIEKMSKSKKNGIYPEDLINIYGVDSLRLSTICSSSLDKDFLWKNKYILNCHKFLKKIYFFIKKDIKNIRNKYFFKKNTININNKKFLFFYYKKLEKINYFYKNIKYNKIISIFFSLFNKFKGLNLNLFVINEFFSSILRIMYPIIPHFCYKLWNKLFYKNELGNILYNFWPKIYIINIKNIDRFILFLNNKKINLLKLKNKHFLIKKTLNYLFFKKYFFKKLYIKKIILNKNIININLY